MANFFKAAKKAWDSNTKAPSASIGNPLAGVRGTPNINVPTSGDLFGGAPDPFYGMGSPKGNSLWWKNITDPVGAGSFTDGAARGIGQGTRDLLSGEGPIAAQKRRDREKREKKRAALIAARNAALYSRSAGINGSVATARSANASADMIAELQMEYDRAQQSRDAASMATIQSLMFMMGAL